MLLIRFCLLSVSLLCLTSSEIKQRSETKTTTKIGVTKEKLQLHEKEGKWYYQGKPFYGYALMHYPNGTLKEKIEYFDGKKEGLFQRWFANGCVQKIGSYNANRLNGTVITWWPNETISSKSYYANGIRHGVQKKWYPNGQLSREMRLNQGKEEGLQQAWRKNGKLYANYEAKNGRFFGLKRSNLCYALKDEEVQW